MFRVPPIQGEAGFGESTAKVSPLLEDSTTQHFMDKIGLIDVRSLSGWSGAQ